MTSRSTNAPENDEHEVTREAAGEPDVAKGIVGNIDKLPEAIFPGFISHSN